MTLVAEVRDFTRFAKPRQLMAPFGPDAERSLERRSDAPRRITKVGNRHARRVLIEGAWTYRFAATLSRALYARTPSRPRRCAPSPGRRSCACAGATDRLAAGGKPKVVVTTAVAREMVGFIWAIASRVQPQPAV